MAADGSDDGVIKLGLSLDACLGVEQSFVELSRVLSNQVKGWWTCKGLCSWFCALGLEFFFEFCVSTLRFKPVFQACVSSPVFQV